MDKGAKLSSATNYFGIPQSSFKGHVHGKKISRKRGCSTVLTVVEEQELMRYLLEMADRGFPLTWLTLRIRVAIMTQGQPTLFKEGILVNGSVRWFKNQHLEISL